MTPGQAKTLGQIKIEVFRAKQIRRGTPYIDEGILPRVYDEIAEKVMKGRDLKTNVK